MGIYESDVIEYMRAGEKVRRVVEWDDYEARFKYVSQNPLDTQFIGNICEYPELLTPGKEPERR